MEINFIVTWCCYATSRLEYKTSVICHNVTHNLKFARRDKPHLLASHRCQAFENLLHIDIAPVHEGNSLRDFTLKKLKMIFISINIFSFYVADKIRLGTVFVQHKKNV